MIKEETSEKLWWFTFLASGLEILTVNIGKIVMETKEISAFQALKEIPNHACFLWALLAQCSPKQGI